MPSWVTGGLPMRLWTAVRLGIVVVAVAAVPGVSASVGPQVPIGVDALADNGRRAGGWAGPIIPGGVYEHSRKRSSAPGELGIPGTVLDAYRSAGAQLASTTPGCRLGWQVLAGVGKVESDHAGGGEVNAQGDALRPVLGPVLDGVRYAAIRDTDGGSLDGNAQWDRAVGPLQFIPSSWAHYAADGNGDGVADPQNTYDAALATATYLCEGGRDLSRRDDLTIALYSYNHSMPYVQTVLSWIDAYAAGRTRPLTGAELAALGPTPRPSGSPTTPAPSSGPATPTAPAGPSSPPVVPGQGPSAPPAPVSPPVPAPVPTVTVTVTVTPPQPPAPPATSPPTATEPPDAGAPPAVPAPPTQPPVGPDPCRPDSPTPSATPTPTPTATPTQTATPTPTAAAPACGPPPVSPASGGAMDWMVDLLRRVVDR